MKRIDLDVRQLTQCMHSLSAKLQASWNEECNLTRSTFANESGEGEFMSCDFRNGKGIITVDATFFEDLTLNFNYYSMSSPIKMLFNTGAAIELCIKDRCNKIEHNHMVLSTLNKDIAYALKLGKMKPIRFALLVIYDSEFLESVTCDIGELPIRDLRGERPFDDGTTVRTGLIDLKIRESLNHIYLNELVDLQRKLFVEGKFNTVFSQMLNKFSTQDTIGKSSLYATQEINIVDKATVILEKEFVNPPTVTELSKTIGTNNNKLHRLFREIKGVTINKFVLMKRMEIARELLNERDYSIAQVAEQVGIANPSYFSKKFKETYGVLPSTYNNNLS